ncbi:cytochrome P450 1A1 [Ambystoma mexicanum]|uniref:cytochrome P450 1A1 n=1 Tax=Ambystoma mexicanum TaxID=8296 RepID=UPI0037E80060
MAVFVLPLVGALSVSQLLLITAIFCLAVLALWSFHQKIPRGLKRLPGPRPYPLIGNVLELGKNPHLSLTELSKVYGEVMQIQIGMRPVLVLSGLDTLKQALLKQGDDFAGRPDLFTFRHIGDGQSLTFSSDSGEVWKARRRLAQNALKTFAAAPCTGSSCSCLLEEHICKEADYLVSKFVEMMETDGGFDSFRYIVVSVANVISAMCFGTRYSHEDQELVSLVNLTDEFGKAAGSGNLADFIPLFQYLPNRTMDVFKLVNTKFVAFVRGLVNEHYQSFDKDNIRDITDSLIDHCQEKKVDENSNIIMSDQKIVNIVNDLFGAGFDTVTTALSWSLMYLVAYPEIQKKLQAELDHVIGKERRPRLSDRAALPYAEAFILEMFRHSSFLPFTIPHSTTRNTSLNGYYIPKDTCVFVNQWQVNHDQNIWKDPFAFHPERFLSHDGSGVSKTEAEKVMTFGLGKRRCIGEFIGRMEVFLFLTTLVQQLDFSKPDGEKLDMSAEYGLTMKHKRCVLHARQRLQADSSE